MKKHHFYVQKQAFFFGRHLWLISSSWHHIFSTWITAHQVLHVFLRCMGQKWSRKHLSYQRYVSWNISGTVFKPFTVGIKLKTHAKPKTPIITITTITTIDNTIHQAKQWRANIAFGIIFMSYSTMTKHKKAIELMYQRFLP